MCTRRDPAHPGSAPRIRSDGRATHRRLLEAATAEFAEHGIAGARVDRIAEHARANKSQLYSYFHSKDELFDAVLAEHVARFVDAAPLDADDLGDYAVRLYDAYLADPTMVRLAAWNRLERRPTGHLFADGVALEEPKLRAVAEAQATGHVRDDLAPEDIHSMVISMSMTWSSASPTFASSSDDPDIHHERRRDALERAIRAAFTPQS